MQTRLMAFVELLARVSLAMIIAIVAVLLLIIYAIDWLDPNKPDDGLHSS